MTVTIIGLGLIGCSMALDLKKRKFTEKIIGIDNNLQHSFIALSNRIVDEIHKLDIAIEKSDLIIVATPVNVIKDILPKILTIVGNKNKIVTDVGSTKSGINKIVKGHENRKKYVASHPMAGTEFSGPLAAENHLFDNKNIIICDREYSSAYALNIVEKMYKKLNMNILYMDSYQHDISAAYVSHISHISSFALSLTVLEKEKNEKNILNLASGGFESTVRLAKSSSEMWVPIFEQNSNFIIEVIDTYIEKLNDFRYSISNNKLDYLGELINKSNKIQKIL